MDSESSKKEDSTERDREKFGFSNNFFFFLSYFIVLFFIWHLAKRLVAEEKITHLVVKDDTHSIGTEKTSCPFCCLFTRSAQGGKLEKYTRKYKVLKYNSVCLRILHVGMTNAINNTIYGVYHHIIVRFTDVFSI